MPPRCAIGVDGPTDTDDDLCILLLFVRCTVKLTVAEAAKEEHFVQVHSFCFHFFPIRNSIYE